MSDRGPTTTTAAVRRLARAWGREVRRAREWMGLTQVEVASVAGISQTTLSRMELGRGMRVPLGAWVEVALAVDVTLEGRATVSRGFGLGTIIGLATAGGWRTADRATTDDETLRLERPPRLARPFRRPQMTQGELAIIRVVDVVTDIDALVADLLEAIGQERNDVKARPGWSVGGVLIVRGTTSNRRRVSERRRFLEIEAPGSGARWIACLDSDRAPMPTRIGLIWMDGRATRLIPTGLRLRGAPR